MTIKIAADEPVIIRPLVERIGGGVNTEKTMSRPNKGDERSLLSIAHGQLAGRVEHHRCIAPEVLGREFRKALRRSDVGQAFSDLSEDCLRRRNGLVPIAGRVRDIEKPFERLLRTRSKRPCGRSAEEGDQRAAVDGDWHLVLRRGDVSMRSDSISRQGPGRDAFHAQARRSGPAREHSPGPGWSNPGHAPCRRATPLDFERGEEEE